MDLAMLRDVMEQFQTGARVTTAVGEPVTVGDRVVIPVAEVAYGGGGGGGGGRSGAEQADHGGGGGGGGGVRVRPLGCWVISPTEEKWVPAVDVNAALVLVGTLAMLLLVTMRGITHDALLPSRRRR